MKMENEIVIEVNNLKKMYKLGQIGGGTLTGDLQSWWARIRKKEDPNTLIGTDPSRLTGKTFMALNGVDFKVYKGETLGIIGANGAGKSTLLKLLAQITAPTEGEIKLKGRIASMLEVGTGFNAEMTGRENIYMNGAILGMPKAEIDAKMNEIIDFSECGDFIDTPVKRYSSGMYVRLAFSVAAHLDSEIMIMDEVLAVGDVKFQKKCLGAMGDAAKNEGRTVLYVSHNMTTIRQLCSRCIVLKEGRIVFDGGVEEAISIYTEENRLSFQKYFDLSQNERPSPQHGRLIRIESIEFLNSEDGIYGLHKPLEFALTINSKIEKECLYLRFGIAYLDSSSAGMAESECLGTIHVGEQKRQLFTFNVKNLAEGNYTFSVDLYTKDEMGGFVSYDNPNQSFGFEVEYPGDNNILWQHKYWGHTRHDSIKVCDLN